MPKKKPNEILQITQTQFEGLISFSFDLENSSALAYLNTRPYEFAQESVDTMLKDLRNIWNDYLIIGIKEGWTIEELTQKVQEVFRGTERNEWWRAERIARTESVGAANMGAESSYNQAKVPYKTWVTMRDGKVRRNHIPMDNVSVPTSDVFILPDGAKMKCPGDPAGGPQNTANDRCTLLGDFAPPSSANGRKSLFNKK
jgi:hypothetical protein